MGYARRNWLIPVMAYPCCATVPVKPNHLSLVSYSTNRYSVPVEVAHKNLILRADPFRIEIGDQQETVASRSLC